VLNLSIFLMERGMSSRERFGHDVSQSVVVVESSFVAGGAA